MPKSISRFAFDAFSWIWIFRWISVLIFFQNANFDAAPNPNLTRNSHLMHNRHKPTSKSNSASKIASKYTNSTSRSSSILVFHFFLNFVSPTFVSNAFQYRVWFCSSDGGRCRYGSQERKFQKGRRENDVQNLISKSSIRFCFSALQYTFRFQIWHFLKCCFPDILFFWWLTTQTHRAGP